MTRFRFAAFPLLAGLALFALASLATAAEPEGENQIPAALANYMARPEPAFAWNIRDTKKRGEATLYDVDLTSQTWQGITWKHVLHIHEPQQVRHPRHVLLFVTGGANGNRPGDDRMAIGDQLAKLSGARVAVLYQVPNQPLFDGRKEDDLITETWLKYLQTGDETWPLLFPMVKSAVKAMDAIQQIGQEKWSQEIEGFVITGGSKRGWTSWLTAVADERIKGTAPMVIDVLNFRPQMQHQLDTWGKYSEQIIDYSSKGLINPGDETEREAHLRRMMDPYTYRSKLTLPKLLINGANDRYWVVDAMKLYWDDLSGPKYALFIPNAGHGLEGGHEIVFATISAFFQHVVTGAQWPQIDWRHSNSGGAAHLSVKSSQRAHNAKIWVARSDTKDFRESKWTSQSLSGDGTDFSVQVDLPEKGHLALFGELQFEAGGIPYTLSSLVQRY